MDSELRELYQQVILDHNKSPRNFRKIENHTHFAEGLNPLCGDHIDIYLIVNDNSTIEDVAFFGNGCAISKSSASILTTMVKGKTIKEAETLISAFTELATGKEMTEDKMQKLGKSAIFQGVREFPARVKCATLAWHTLDAAINGEDSTISTE